MTTESNRQLMERYIKALSGSSKSPELVDQFVADQSLKEHIAIFEAAFPGYDIDLEEMLADGDKVAIRGSFRGVQLGEFQGIPPTGREVRVPLMLIYRIADGKIAEFWMNADLLGLLQQLSAVPVPAATS